MGESDGHFEGYARQMVHASRSRRVRDTLHLCMMSPIWRPVNLPRARAYSMHVRNCAVHARTCPPSERTSVM